MTDRPQPHQTRPILRARPRDRPENSPPARVENRPHAPTSPVNGSPPGPPPTQKENAMLIKSRMGISADGFVATPDGWPALLTAPDFVPAVSHGYPEFIEGVDAVVMGRNTFVPALGSPEWPWEGLQVFVLTSRPLPDGTPDGVAAAQGGPAGLLGQLRSRGPGGDLP